MVRTTKPANDKKNKGGRPTKYDPSMCETVIEVMAGENGHQQGGLKVHVAAELGICEDTLYRWIKRYPEFSEAIKIGTTMSKAWWVDKVRKFVHNPRGETFNLGGWQWIMMNCFGWTSNKADNRERKEETITHKMSFEVEDLSTDELRVLHRVLGQYLSSRTGEPVGKDRPGAGAAQHGGTKSSTIH